MDRVLTDEQFTAYLDAATDRLRADATGDQESLVEAVRSGWIFAHDDRQYRRWRQRTRSAITGVRRGGLTGAALERAVMGLAARNPEYVIREGAA